MIHLSNRLASRLAILLTLALAPLGSIAIFAEYGSWKTEKTAQEAGLLVRTLDAVTGQRAILESAASSADTLIRSLRDVLDDPAVCSELLEDYIRRTGFYAFAGFIGTDYVMDCISQGDALDFSENEHFAGLFESPRNMFSFQDAGIVSGMPVVVVTRQVIHEDRLLGFLIVSISRARFDLIATSPSTQTGPKKIYLLNHLGDALPQSDGDNTKEMLPNPETIASFIDARNGIFRARSVDGEARVFTLSELAPRQLFVLGSWEADDPQVQSRINLMRLSFPLLMWLASIAVVMLAVHYLVVRHLRHINSQLRRFALGNRDEFQRLPSVAPSELRELDSTFTKMARLIRRDESEREEALREKTMLLREVHHRVKNNLQLIASILNLQFRRLQDPQARTILRGVQLRVRSLASIHQTLYSKNRISDANATAFFEAILTETLAMSQSDMSGLIVDTRFEPVTLPPDKIIPASLLFAEAVTNAIKYAAPPKGQTAARIEISFLPHDNIAELRVFNSLAEEGPSSASDGLGRELMTAFALQINADFEIGPIKDENGFGWEMRLRLNQADVSEDTSD